MRLGAVVLDAKNPRELADFYAKLLGWPKEVQTTSEGEWIVVKSKSGEGIPLVFQEEPLFESPQWPSVKGKQQQMEHLDFYIDKADLEEETNHAINCGATLIEEQPSENWRVLRDPAGHTFCIIPIP